MAIILFYEKPGCINNKRQKALLTAAGHHVVAHNLLIEAWTIDRLQLFFGQHPVVDWFNHAAPQIKSGAVIPEQLDAQTALQLMIQNPLLIRRPLMQVGDRYAAGFDPTIEWLGLTATDAFSSNPNLAADQPDLQTCPHPHNPCR